MTVGFFSPMPPARTGVADYAAALFEALQRLGTVRLNDAGADICLYHIGNNHLHRPIYNQALSRPGVIVLHDAVLHHFLLGALSEEEYIREFSYNYGQWNSDAAHRLWRSRARSGVDAEYFRYPMLRRIVERSKAVIVHNSSAARMVGEQVPAARVFEIPHLFQPPPNAPASEVIRLRERLGIAAHTFLFGIFGHLRESKRLAAVLRIFERLITQGADIALLIAGEFASSDLRRSMAPQFRRERIVCTGYLAEADFWTHAAAVDACINLRYPQAGETSGIAIRLMGIGKPVLITNVEEMSGFSNAAGIPIDPGPAEEEMLAAAMIWLAENPRDALDIGRIARDYIARNHRPDQAAERYWELLSNARN
jgi:glycosyltransferase involved in cell wall biosynthesis